MNITPLEIRKNEFKKSLRGYDVEEVAAFLDLVAMEFENLIRENAILNEKNSNITEQLKKYHDLERVLQETLISAEKTKDDTLKTAKKQADVIIREAEVKASSVIEDARIEMSRLRVMINELKIHKDSYLSKITALINTQLETFENISFPEEDIFKKIDSSLGDDDMYRKNNEKTSKPPVILDSNIEDE